MPRTPLSVDGPCPLDQIHFGVWIWRASPTVKHGLAGFAQPPVYADRCSDGAQVLAEKGK